MQRLLKPCESYAAGAGRRTELDVDEALLPRDPGENLGVDLHHSASISRQEGKKQASSLCAWGEWVECGGDLGEVSGNHPGGLCDWGSMSACAYLTVCSGAGRPTRIAIEEEMEL